MKILHSADFHLDSPFSGRSAEETDLLRRALLAVPERIADICAAEKCDMVLLAGDLFDGTYSRESSRALYAAMERMAVPVFISPGNHDFLSPNSPWEREKWPENVHVFTKDRIESVAVPALDCRVYGAGYQSMDCPGLLAGFRAEGQARYHIGILHADPTQAAGPYCPMTAEQIRESGLNYLALGHVHKTGSFRAGETLCAWPGCPMGRGNDETGIRGILLTEVDETVRTTFLPLDTLRFYDLQTEAGNDAAAAVARLLPPAGSSDFYRITLTGYANEPNLDAIRAQLANYPHLDLRDETIPETDLWGTAGDDSLEGLYFGMLRAGMEGQDEAACSRIRLAAQISRQILDGQEVRLP